MSKFSNAPKIRNLPTSPRRSRRAAVTLTGLALAGFAVMAADTALAQNISVPRMMGFQRSYFTTNGIGRVGDTVMLRSRDDYSSVYAMIDAETRIITAEANALRMYNDSTESELTASMAELEALREARVGARVAREREAQMRQRVAERKADAEQRLKRAENELGTTEDLRESAPHEGASPDLWQSRVDELRAQRDQLRLLLKRVSLLSDSLG